MRRKEKEIVDRSEMDAVIRDAIVCHVGLSDGNIPYVVPLSFGYQDSTVYVHGAIEGRKIDILRKNNHVCVTFVADAEIVEGGTSCEWGMRYRSVVGFGRALFVEDTDDKKSGLEVIMKQYSNQPASIPTAAVDGTVVIKIKIDSITGKRSGV